ncbi:DUF4365 domain-containing protein [Pedosphaera parvula]|uniref:DUF4365 domain-containing protein n=1 Tax=Pedosphaera parvula TaxID=1032527 RepID=UPI001237967A|nr:DUF4365 domain-containing protein [Pedosphaera parvula]
MNPKFLAQATFQGATWDYMAAFQTKAGRLINITVKVIATEKPIPEEMIFVMSNKQANEILNSNLPILIVVVDVKTNSIACNWVSKATVSHSSRLNGDARIRFPALKVDQGTVGKLIFDIEKM